MRGWTRRCLPHGSCTMLGKYHYFAYVGVICFLCALVYILMNDGYILTLMLSGFGKCSHIGNGTAETDSHSMHCKEMFLERLRDTMDFDSLFYNTSIEEELESCRMGTPLQPLKQFRSPCWVSERAGHWRLRCVPAVYLMGFAKSGTSDIHSALCRHPAVLRGHSKEYHYWDFRRLASWGQPVSAETFSQYADDFDPSMDQLLSLDNGKGRMCPTNSSHCVELDPNKYYRGIVVDGTPSYMHMYGGWEQIPANRGLDEPRVTLAHTLQALYPGTKFIVTLRHPIDRAFSNFRHFVKFGTSEIFHEVMMTSIDLWQNCLIQHSVRACAFNYSLIPCDSLYKCGVYLRASLYPVYLAEWLEVFPRRQIHLVKAEDYYTDRRPTVSALLSFLELSDLPPAEMAALTSDRVHNSRRRKQASTQPMLNATRDRLHRFFKPYVRKLVDMTQDNRFTWDFEI